MPIIVGSESIIHHQWTSHKFLTASLKPLTLRKLQSNYRVLVDLSKAFYTLNCDFVLVQKLNPYGLNGTDLLRFKSYLSARSNT